MDHTEEPRLFVEFSHWDRLTKARHELRIIRSEVRRPYLAYCPCGDFVLEAGNLDFVSWAYRRHINDDPSVPADA